MASAPRLRLGDGAGSATGSGAASMILAWLPARALQAWLWKPRSRLKLLVGHALDAAGMLNSHFPRDQKHEQFQEDGRLLLHHFVDCRATAPAKGGVHLPDGVGVEGMTRAVDVAAKISTRTWFNARLCRNEVSERIPRGRE